MIGFVFIALALLAFFKGYAIAGGVLFFIGGFLTKNLFVSLRSAGLTIFVSAFAHGLFNGFSEWIFFIIVIAFLMACLPAKKQKSENSNSGEWGIDFNPSDRSDSGGFGDGGSDCGGGGGD